MKQFEKWLDSPDNKELNELYEKDAPVQDWTEAGYRRALEWMLAQETSIAYSVPVVLTDIIRKELEDETKKT